MNVHKNNFTPIKQLDMRNFYENNKFYIGIFLTIFVFIMLLVIVWCLHLEKQNVISYSLEEIVSSDSIILNLNRYPSEETRLGKEAILIFMLIGAAILGFKKGTLGIMGGVFLGSVVGMLIFVNCPRLIYFIEWITMKLICQYR